MMSMAIILEILSKQLVQVRFLRTDFRRPFSFFYFVLNVCYVSHVIIFVRNSFCLNGLCSAIKHCPVCVNFYTSVIPWAWHLLRGIITDIQITSDFLILWFARLSFIYYVVKNFNYIFLNLFIFKFFFLKEWFRERFFSIILLIQNIITFSIIVTSKPFFNRKYSLNLKLYFLKIIIIHLRAFK